MKSYTVLINSETIDKAKELFKINDEAGISALLAIAHAGYIGGIGRGLLIGGITVTAVGCIGLVAKKVITLIKNRKEQNQKEES